MKINCKENYIAEGLVHTIYKYNKDIYKVPKDEFEDFNNTEHFFIEKTSHEILREASLPAVKVLNIYNRGELIEDKCVLKEKFIQGNIIDNPNLNDLQRKKIITNLLEVNNIKIPGFGRINSKGGATFSKWSTYIKFSMAESLPIIENYRKSFLRNYLTYLSKNIGQIPEISKGIFLMLDTNSNNYIFDSRGEIIAMLDVDHPSSGDRLYEYSALNFHHPETFEILKNQYINFNKKELEIIKYYFIHFAINTIAFELEHHLDITKSLRRLRDVSI